MANDSGRNLGIDPKVDILDGGDEPLAEFVHDRWPHFTSRASDCEIKIQFVASGGTIFQTYEFFFDGIDIQPPKVATGVNLLIRQLDFINSANWVNGADLWSAVYKTELSGDKTRIKRSHHINEGEVALFISAYCEEELVKFQHEEKQVEKQDDEQDSGEDTSTGKSQEDQKENNGVGETFGIVWSDKALEYLQRNKSLKVTFAYCLEYFANRDERIPPHVNAEAIGTAVQQVDDEPFEEHHFTEDGDINQVLRRNLEHILSVCSIPVIAEGSKSDQPVIALTSGDVDGHRVATAASFYCFELLLLALDYFESQQHTCRAPGLSCYICIMKQRILKVCQGHLKWLFGKEYRNLSENPSVTHCWVSGKVIDNWDENLYLPGKSLVEVPFQIIKAGDFYARHKKWEVPKEAGTAVQTWINELDQRNRLGRYAFPRYRSEPTYNFYFTDHVFIWRAIKSAEILGFKSELNVSIQAQVGGDAGGQPAKKSIKGRNYSSIEAQKQILKRFTTENPISKKRMIAVSRSPAHNRFLLRSKDSGLFQAMDLGLFDKLEVEKGHDIWQNKIDVWRNLVDAQVFHEDNDDTTWDEPMRFALSFIMAQNGKCMNQRSAEAMRQRAISVLLHSAWSNGLFSGELDHNNEPILYYNEIMRDPFRGVSFEVPYILWKYSRSASAAGGDPHTQFKHDVMTKKAKATSSSDTELLNFLKDLLEQRNGAGYSASPMSNSMKCSIPLNNVMDRGNIVELADEWLYNEPDFFSLTSVRSENSSSASSIDDHLPLSRDAMPQGPNKIVVIDVPRSKMSRFRVPGLDDLIKEFQTSTELEIFMRKKRLPSTAKKRFCALFATCPDANRVYSQTPSENLDLKTFTKRHVSYYKFFEQVTAPGLNKWTTEFHLSFYEIDMKGPSSNVNNHFSNLRARAEKESSGRLTRTVMSFRFDGDFFDRYWTCHFLESDPQMTSDLDAKREVIALLQPGGRESARDSKAPWRQRRVLELLLFGRIMLRMQECAADILEDAKLNAWRKPGGSKAQQGTEDAHLRSSAEFDYDNFRVASWWCQEYQRMLRMIEKDIRENLDKIELWLNREKEFGSERPRWSFNDESRYRSVISKLLIENNRRVEELKRGHASISRFNASLNEKFQIARNDFDQRQADNIKRFTYVTVVFLPLGFATGIFSMSQAPASRTLIDMVVTAVVALVATLLLLFSAETLESIYNCGFIF
ncbi:hypothetical protein QQX98_008399 [Neonectria punicea]|uniref:Uncharacterized protein n=1 Tax=Neonectria punicea TaxID=979145 RepID=A0ABR1GVB7_9HYPO